jgi:hypothetical protein
MEQKIIQAVLGILVALMAWKFKTVNDLQKQMVRVQTGHVTIETLHALQRSVDRLEIILERQAMEK